jgi:hypothetical protein
MFLFSVHTLQLRITISLVGQGIAVSPQQRLASLRVPPTGAGKHLLISATLVPRVLSGTEQKEN